MLMNRRHAAAWLVPASVVLGGLAGCAPAVPPTLKVGVLTTLSGPYAPRGKDLLDGAQLAADQLNESRYRINGQPVKIEVIAADDKGDVEAATRGAQDLIDQGVHAVIGPLLVPQLTAAIKTLAPQGTPHMFATTTTSLMQLGSGNTFRLLAHDDLQGRAMAMFVHESLRGERIAVITEAGDYGRGLQKTVGEALAGVQKRFAFQTEIDPKAEVPPEMAQQLKEARCDVVVLLAREVQLRSLLKTLKDVGHTDVAIIGPNAIRNKNSARLPITVRAMYATATAIDPEEFPMGRKFVTDFEARFKAPPIWGAHYAYDGVYALADAARRAGSVEHHEVIAKLKTIDPMTQVNQQMRFNSQGEQLYASIGIYKVERGAWVSQMRSSIW